jgi:hypothetical protein
MSLASPSIPRWTTLVSQRGMTNLCARRYFSLVVPPPAGTLPDATITQYALRITQYGGELAPAPAMRDLVPRVNALLQVP